MSPEVCRALCPCEGFEFTPTPVDDTLLAQLASKTLLDPPGALEEDPYEHPGDHPLSPDSACGALFEGEEEYHLETFPGPEEAVAAGATVTHMGACGLCSSLADLAVYMSHGNLTTPVR